MQETSSELHQFSQLFCDLHFSFHKEQQHPAPLFGSVSWISLKSKLRCVFFSVLHPERTVAFVLCLWLLVFVRSLAAACLCLSLIFFIHYESFVLRCVFFSFKQQAVCSLLRIKFLRSPSHKLTKKFFLFLFHWLHELMACFCGCGSGSRLINIYYTSPPCWKTENIDCTSHKSHSKRLSTTDWIYFENLSAANIR